MKKIVLFILILVLTFPLLSQNNSFLSSQKKYERVRTAFVEKEQVVKNNLQKESLTTNDLNILITAYKAEKKLEIYGKKKAATTYKKIAEYNICRSSGNLGPKRKEGDLQFPEGYYYINNFNPVSSYYLSLGINYPNSSDKIKSRYKKLGGDIFIHGKCVTIGCLPMTDDKIKEIYLYAVYAKDNGQNKIPVYIFPFKMTNINMKTYTSKYKKNEELVNFWNNLKTGYDKFYESQALKVSVSKKGDYIFN